MLITKNVDVECCDICHNSICLKGNLTPENLCPICHNHICQNCGIEIKYNSETLFLCCHRHAIDGIAKMVISELRNRNFTLSDDVPVKISEIKFEKITN